jgi:hypothetical protein
MMMSTAENTSREDSPKPRRAAPRSKKTTAKRGAKKPARRAATKKAASPKAAFPKHQVIDAFNSGGIDEARKVAEKLGVTHKLSIWRREGHLKY